MTNDPNKPQGPWKLNSGRVVLLMMGTLLVAIIASTLLGGLTNYQHLRDGPDSTQAPAPAGTTTSP